MLDDIDKGGMAKGKDYSGDGGTSGNQMQMILTEASDPFSPIIWGFTFNRLPDLPELFRPGRLDRCFYVERPNSADPPRHPDGRRSPGQADLRQRVRSFACWPNRLATTRRPS